MSSRNLLSPASGDPIVAPSLDMVLGCYYMTDIDTAAPGAYKASPTAGKDGRQAEGRVGSFEEAKLAFDLGTCAVGNGEPFREIGILPAQLRELVVNAARIAGRDVDGFGELGDARLGTFARTFEIGPRAVRLLQGVGQALVLLLDVLERLALFCQRRRGFEQLLELCLGGCQHLVQVREPAGGRLLVSLRLLLGARLLLGPRLPAGLGSLSEDDAR